MRNNLIPLVIAIAARSLTAQAPAVTQVPDEPSCARCTITVRTVVTLGSDDGVGSLNGRPMSVNVDARGRWWLFQELEPPTVFSAGGTVDRMVGRKGRGPGEFQSANDGVVIGDSMLVFDWLESRATMLGPDFNLVRFIRMFRSHNKPHVLEWPRLLIASGYVATANPPNSTMHRFAADSDGFRVLGSFGPRGTGGGAMGNSAVQQVVGPARGGIWSVYYSRPELTRWNGAGKAEAVLRRQMPWFTGDKEPTVGWGTAPPTPMTAEVREDAEGLVWLFVRLPAPTWKEGFGSTTKMGGEILSRSVAWDRVYRTYVEVIDPALARVIARHTFDGYVFEALPDRRAALYIVDFQGIPRVRIVQLQLTGR